MKTLLSKVLYISKYWKQGNNKNDLVDFVMYSGCLKDFYSLFCKNCHVLWLDFLTIWFFYKSTCCCLPPINPEEGKDVFGFGVFNYCITYRRLFKWKQIMSDATHRHGWWNDCFGAGTWHLSYDFIFFAYSCLRAKTNGGFAFEGAAVWSALQPATSGERPLL